MADPDNAAKVTVLKGIFEFSLNVSRLDRRVAGRTINYNLID